MQLILNVRCLSEFFSRGPVLVDPGSLTTCSTFGLSSLSQYKSPNCVSVLHTSPNRMLKLNRRSSPADCRLSWSRLHSLTWCPSSRWGSCLFCRHLICNWAEDSVGVKGLKVWNWRNWMNRNGHVCLFLFCCLQPVNTALFLPQLCLVFSHACLLCALTVNSGAFFILFFFACQQKSLPALRLSLLNSQQSLIQPPQQGVKPAPGGVPPAIVTGPGVRIRHPNSVSTTTGATALPTGTLGHVGAMVRTQTPVRTG